MYTIDWNLVQPYPDQVDLDQFLFTLGQMLRLHYMDHPDLGQWLL